MTIFFSADLHCGHANILRYCDRPFETVEQMWEIMRDRWNDRVSDKDTVYVLGDFSLSGREKVAGYREQLHGRVVLVRGNHDLKLNQLKSIFDEVYEYKEIHVDDKEMDTRQAIVMCHYPFASWNKKTHGSWALHGHSHGTLPSIPGRMDVGVDCNGFAPVSYEEVKLYFTRQMLAAQKDNK